STQPFVFDFNCTVSQSVCDSAKKGFERAGELISRSIVISESIVVQANFRSFCNGAQKCNEANTIGLATSAARFPAKRSPSAPVLYYAQALAKQVQKDQPLVYNKYDILADFNADYPFYFPDQKTPIQPNQVDFIFVVAHELTHGLGFDSGWIDYAVIFPTFTRDNSYIAPLLFSNGPTQNTAKVLQFEPLDNYDQYLINANNKEPVQVLADSIFKFQKRNVLISDFISSFERSGSPYTSAQAMRSLVKKGSKTVAFLTNDGKSVGLTTGTYEQGTSLVHLDYDDNWQTPDFLMIPQLRNLTGKALDDIIRQNTGGKGLPNGGIYGPNTRSIMNTMGWPL
ncbi:hypothetical protein EDD86DRAFT_173799, partial [Gorgonomyces haynaldii]